MGGYSGGAMMTLRYACEVPGRIAGTALVGAQMITTLAAKCDTSAPPAMMFIDGDEDPLASYDGNATLMSLPASAAFWAQANGCNMTPRRERSLHRRRPRAASRIRGRDRSEEHTSELQSLMRIS